MPMTILPDKKIYFMSYAVIQSGGKQYKVKSGEILKLKNYQIQNLTLKLSLMIYWHMVIIKL